MFKPNFRYTHKLAGVTHYELVRIHPFADGNGRTARVMASLILFKRGFDIKRFFALDDYYDHDQSSQNPFWRLQANGFKRNGQAHENGRCEAQRERPRCIL